MYVWSEGVKHRVVKKATPKLAITGNQKIRDARRAIFPWNSDYDSAYIIKFPPVFMLLTMNKPKSKKNDNKEKGTKRKRARKITDADKLWKIPN